MNAAPGDVQIHFAQGVYGPVAVAVGFTDVFKFYHDVCFIETGAREPRTGKNRVKPKERTAATGRRRAGNEKGHPEGWPSTRGHTLLAALHRQQDRWTPAIREQIGVW
ncbi:hypothetical protein GCM10027172_12000 [Halomonas garicola]